MSKSNNLPSFDSLRSTKTPVFSSIDMLRVRWKPFGPLQSTIEVAEDLDAGPSLFAYPHQINKDNIPSFHQISTCPATNPPVSSITVRISDLEDWAWRWAENHENCGEGYDDEHQKWIEDEGDENDEEEEEPPRRLVRCCNQDRPQAPLPLEVRPFVQNYITIHDYITQVHAWVEGLQADIVAAMKENSGVHLSALRYMTLLSLDTPHIREDRQGRADRHWQSVAEHAKLRRDGRMISGSS